MSKSSQSVSNTAEELYEVNRLEYMKMVQDIVKRMANNSFSMKGWCISITSGIFGINVWTDSSWQYFLFLLFPIVVFWLLDTYYLRQERLFRGVYDRVRKYNAKELQESKYSMKPPMKGDSDYKKSYTYFNVFKSGTELGLYGSLFAVAIAFIVIFATIGDSNSASTTISEVLAK